MKKITIRMKILYIFIICTTFIDIQDDLITEILGLKSNVLWEVILDVWCSLIILLFITWVISLGKKVISEYEKKEEHYRKLIELSPEAFFVYRNGKIIFANNAGVALLGGNCFDDLLPHNWNKHIHSSANDLNKIKENSKYCMSGVYNFQTSIRRLDGKIIDLEITSTNIDYDGLPAREFIARDITLRKSRENVITKLAYQDMLTELPNRRAFFDRLEKLILDSKASQTQFAVFFIDLDGFKIVNDTYGHDIGDELLKKVSVTLKRCVRDRDIDLVARLAGDEFTILLPKTNRLDCSLVADRIINNLNIPIHIMEKGIRITPSIGISIYPQNGDDPITLIKKADEAMYQAKKNGKNGYQFV